MRSEQKFKASSILGVGLFTSMFPLCCPLSTPSEKTFKDAVLPPAGISRKLSNLTLANFEQEKLPPLKEVENGDATSRRVGLSKRINFSNEELANQFKVEGAKLVSQDFTFSSPWLSCRNLPAGAVATVVVGNRVLKLSDDNDRTPVEVYSALGQNAHIEIANMPSMRDVGMPGRAGANVQFVNGPNTKLQRRFEELIAAHLRKTKIPGICVAASVDGKIVACVTSGVRSTSDPDRTPITATDKLMWGSISKPITNTIIGALVQKGVMKWDTTFAQVFPEAKQGNSNPSLDAPVWMLMNHTSGLGYINPHPEDPTITNGTAWRYRDSIEQFKLKPVGPPGQKELYTAGCTAAIAMAEKLTGQSYEELLKKYIFGPFGMQTAGLNLPGPVSMPPSFPMAHIQTTSEEVAKPNFDIAATSKTQLWKYGPATAVHGSIIDMCLFGTNYVMGCEKGSAGLSSATFQQLLTIPNQTKNISIRTVGGWEKPNDTWFQHGGVISGYNCMLLINPTEKLCLAYFRNTDLKGQVGPWDTVIDDLRWELFLYGKKR